MSATTYSSSYYYYYYSIILPPFASFGFLRQVILRSFQTEIPQEICDHSEDLGIPTLKAKDLKK
jgi:hypothetical protein